MSNAFSSDIPALEQVENSTPPHDSDFTDDSDDDETMEEQTTCLFCPQVIKSIELAMQHIKDDHNVNFCQMKAKFNMDQYSFIKLINCLRSEEGITAEKLIGATEAFWNDEKYLKPKEYETWLSYGIYLFSNFLQTKNMNLVFVFRL